MNMLKLCIEDIFCQEIKNLLEDLHLVKRPTLFNSKLEIQILGNTKKFCADKNFIPRIMESA